MLWTRKIKAIILLEDLDLGKGKYQNPLLGRYKIDIFRPVANIYGYLTSCLLEAEDDLEIVLDRPVEAVVTFTSGDFVLHPDEEYLLQMGSRRIGKFRVVEVLK